MSEGLRSSVAVLTADVVGSRHIPAKELEARTQTVAQEIETALFSKQQTFEFYRGDSFQALLESHEEALRTALLWRAAMKAATTGETQWDIRVAIGIGSIDHRGQTLAVSGGAAFQQSGTLLDSMKRSSEARIGFHTADELWTAVLNTECILAEGIISRWTVTGAKTIYQQLLSGETQEVLAAKAGVTQSAIHKRLQAVGWPALRHWESHYRKTAAHYLNGANPE